MVIRVAAMQIPDYWEAIKYAIDQVSSYSPERRQEVLNKYLIKLLCEEMQCWFLLNSERHIKTLAITELTNTYQTVEIHILCIYGFESTTIGEREEWWKTLDEWAKNIDAKRILTFVSNSKYGQALEEKGFKVRDIVYMKERR
jgi:hypothetical protein